MGIKYDKEIVKKDRIVTTRGPRDLQARSPYAQDSNQSELVSLLRSEIERLTKILADRTLDSNTITGYTDEQVNEEIVKAVTSETARLKLEYERVVKDIQMGQVHIENENKRLIDEKQHLSNTIESLKSELLNRDTTIDSLKKDFQTSQDNKLTILLSEATKKIEEMSSSISNLQTSEQAYAKSSTRPQMETVFVDPIDKESKVEKHFEIEDVTISQKEEMGSKVSKLKSLLGKLPDRRG